jgi:hypothetical protein
MPVGPVIPENIVIVFKGRTDPYGHGFLPGAQVHGATDLFSEDRFDKTLFTEANTEHRSIQVHQYIY